VSLTEKYLRHALKSDLVNQPSVRNRMMNLPVCPHCERPALRDTRRGDPVRGYITCPVCGYHGPTTMSVKCFMQEHVSK